MARWGPLPVGGTDRDDAGAKVVVVEEREATPLAAVAAVGRKGALQGASGDLPAMHAVLGSRGGRNDAHGVSAVGPP